MGRRTSYAEALACSVHPFLKGRELWLVLLEPRASIVVYAGVPEYSGGQGSEVFERAQDKRP